MNRVRQSCRPKHQVLVLKCYPRFQKSQTSVKPNGSELSYLLYYASTRRSKLQKLGSFLNKRTVTDVYHLRIGNVQVSLEIIRALIEKCSRDLALFAGEALQILRTVLKSGDVTMAESTVEVWDTFCKAQDAAMLAADQEYIRLYEEIVQLYVAFASKDKPFTVKGQTSVPTSMRFRNLGLQAIKSVADSHVITADTARQLNLVIPVVLENLYSSDPSYVQVLQQREYYREKAEKEQAMRRRQSISTVRTAEEGEPDPAAALGTTEEGDKLAEQDVGITALQALRTIFSSNNRALLRHATASVARFVASHINPREHFNKQEYHTLQSGTWATNLFGELCGWASVQDRFVILVTTMDLLIRSPIVENDLPKQYTLAVIVGWLLSSPIYFIGLSVMDVLLGLLQHVSLLLQLGGSDSDIRPHRQQPIIPDVNLAPELVGDQRASPASRGSAQEIVQSPSDERVQLLDQVLRCIGNLATHVYYTDQIPDMITAVMRRLQPSAAHNPSAVAAAIEDPSSTVETLARTVSMKEKPDTDHFFSFDTARVAALEAVKAIVVVANGRAPDGTSNASGRSQIGTSVWEGTQWLLRDPSFQVRIAYHDALVTWLDLESKRSDLRVMDTTPARKQTEKKENGNAKSDSLARRAVSNASQRDRSPGVKRNTFLELLHLAIYENAHQFADRETDMLLLHSLLSTLVSKLGINSVRSGLPMIMCLQKEIPSVEPAQSRINVASLVHGYFWALAVYFDFDASATARTILNEITRRTHDGTWLQSIRVPPLPPQQTQQTAMRLATKAAPPSETAPQPEAPSDDSMNADAFKPFDNKGALVEKVAQGYSMSLYSPPTSPPGSPSRSFSVPILAAVGRTKSIASQQGSILRAGSPTRGPVELPQRVRDELLHEWSRENCIASTTKESSRSTTGSFGASGSLRDRNRSAKQLAPGASPGSSGNVSVNGPQNPRFSEYLTSPRGQHLTPAVLNAAAGGPSSRGTQDSPDPQSTSSARSAVRIEDLKRVLTGATAGGGALRTAWAMRGSTAPRWSTSRDSSREGDADDTASDSMVSADVSTSDLADTTEMNFPLPPGADALKAVDDHRVGESQAGGTFDFKEDYPTHRPVSGHAHANSEDTIRPFVNHQVDLVEPAVIEAEDEDIPPVPRIPSEFDLTRPRGRQIDTDAESSVYMTPGESPAPTERNATSSDLPREDGDQHFPEAETPRAQRDSYFTDGATPIAQQQRISTESPETVPGAQTPRQVTSPSRDHAGEEAVVVVPSTPREIYVEKKGRLPPAEQQQQQHQSLTSPRKSIIRSVSSGAADATPANKTTIKRPISLRHHDGPDRRRVTLQRGTSFRSNRESAAGGPMDVKALLEGIEVDGRGADRAARRPPY